MPFDGFRRLVSRANPVAPSWRRLPLYLSAGILLLLSACATPVQVERVDPQVVNRELTSNVISTGNLSEPTQIALHREDLSNAFESYPEQTIAYLHRMATAGKPDPDALFTLSELSFRYAEDTGRRSYYLASAVYAFGFLFPDDPGATAESFRPPRPDSKRPLQPQHYLRFCITGSFPSCAAVRQV